MANGEVLCALEITTVGDLRNAHSHVPASRPGLVRFEVFRLFIVASRAHVPICP